MTEKNHILTKTSDSKRHRTDDLEEISRLSLLTVEQAAIYLQLSPKTIWTHTKRGLLPVCRIGGLVRYRRQALDETLAKLETRSTARK